MLAGWVAGWDIMCTARVDAAARVGGAMCVCVSVGGWVGGYLSIDRIAR